MERANWYWIFIIVAALLFSSWHSHASEIQYISETERTSLKDDFDKATPLTSVTGKWICDMYGVSSNLQVKKAVPLYTFETVKDGFENHGAQAKSVPVYHASKGELLGKGPTVEDQLRRLKNGQLLSRLTHEGQVVAYSRCRPG